MGARGTETRWAREAVVFSTLSPGFIYAPYKGIESSGKLILGMHCSCVRHTELPHTTQLFLDVLYHPDGRPRFTAILCGDEEAYRAAAGENSPFPEEQRRGTWSRLRVQIPIGESAPSLARRVRWVVATGQQVGLFSGRRTRFNKALQCGETGPMADVQRNPRGSGGSGWRLKTTTSRKSITSGYSTRIHAAALAKSGVRQLGSRWETLPGSAPPVQELRAILSGMPFGQEAAALVEELPAGRHDGQGVSETC